MDNRKSLINEYKQGTVTGGVYRVANTHNGMYLLDCAVNLQGKQNMFNFMVSSGSCMDYRLRKDWEEFGNKAFTFEILEPLEKKKEQSAEEFAEDLKTLLQMWSARLDPALRY